MKRELLDLVEAANKGQAENANPLILLTLRFMIDIKFSYETPFQQTEPDSVTFMQVYLDYLS